jgi:DNA-binding IclR family transcriptional regulator
MPSNVKALSPGGALTSNNDLDGDIGSARRMLRLLTAFTANEPQMTAEQLARRTALPLSSTYRYLSMLREFGLVEECGRKLYQVGPASIRLAQAARTANPLERIARPFLCQLSGAADETVVLLRRMNEKAICVDGIEASRVIRPKVRVGSSVPLHVGAGPKLLLASLPEATRSHTIKQCALRFNLDTEQVAILQDEVQIINNRGWAECYGGVFPDIYAVAAPIRDEDRVVASMSVVAPVFRVSEQRQAQLREIVVNGAAQISTALSTPASFTD